MSNRKFDVEEKKATNIYSTHDVSKAISEFLEEALPQTGRKLSMKWSNIRLGLMFLACAAALYGQFGVKFPADKLILGLCVGVYFLLSGLVTLVDYLIIKESCLILSDSQGGIFVGVVMKKGESQATLSFRRGADKKEFKLDLDKLFDDEGTLLQNATLNTFESHLNSFTKADKKQN